MKYLKDDKILFKISRTNCYRKSPVVYPTRSTRTKMAAAANNSDRAEQGVSWGGRHAQHANLIILCNASGLQPRSLVLHCTLINLTT